MCVTAVAEHLCENSPTAPAPAPQPTSPTAPQPTRLTMGMALDDELAKEFFKVVVPVSPPCDTVGKLVAKYWVGDDHSLRRYFLAGCRMFARPKFLSLSVDDSRVGLRTRMMIAAALTNNTATRFAPQVPFVRNMCQGLSTAPCPSSCLVRLLQLFRVDLPTHGKAVSGIQVAGPKRLAEVCRGLPEHLEKLPEYLKGFPEAT